MSSSELLEPTPYREVNQLLVVLLARVQAILREKLVGFYLYGSLSSGDFEPESSDVDFLVVTSEELGEKILAELGAMHAEIAASGLPYATRLEGSYIPTTALRRYDLQNASHPTIGVDWGFQLGEHKSNWIIERQIVREHGVRLYGPSPDTLIDSIPSQELKKAVCEMLMGFWQAQLAQPEWLRPRDYQAFAVLTMCRALYTLNQGTVTSKPKAASWAIQTLAASWRPLIERALTWRHQHELDDLADTLAFIRFAVTVGKEVCSSTMTE